MPARCIPTLSRGREEVGGRQKATNKLGGKLLSAARVNGADDPASRDPTVDAPNSTSFPLRPRPLTVLPVPHLSATVQFTTQRYAVQFTTQRYVVQFTTQRYALQFTTQRYALQCTTQRYAVQFTTQRYVVQFTTQQYALQFTTQRYALQFTAQRYVVQFTTQRYVVQFVAISGKSPCTSVTRCDP